MEYLCDESTSNTDIQPNLINRLWVKSTLKNKFREQSGQCDEFDLNTGQCLVFDINTFLESGRV